MKMHGLLFGSLFWGILISLIGVSIILKYALNIDLPLARLFFGIILILLGIRIVFGHNNKHYIKNHSRINAYHSSEECSIIFSSGTIDLSQYPDDKKIPSELNVIFGQATVLVPETMKLEITSTTVFGSTVLPERVYNGFGEDKYTMNKSSNSPIRKIETNTIFGRLNFEMVSVDKSPNAAFQDSTQTKENETF